MCVEHQGCTGGSVKFKTRAGAGSISTEMHSNDGPSLRCREEYLAHEQVVTKATDCLITRSEGHGHIYASP